MLVHPPLFGNTASKLPVKNCKIFFWPRLFFYVLPAKNSSCKTAVNDIQFCSKWPTRRGHRPNGVNQPPRLQKINPNVRLVPFLAPFTWFLGLTRCQHWPRANWVLKNVENHSKITPNNKQATLPVTRSISNASARRLVECAVVNIDVTFKFRQTC